MYTRRRLESTHGVTREAVGAASEVRYVERMRFAQCALLFMLTACGVDPRLNDAGVEVADASVAVDAGLDAGEPDAAAPLDAGRDAGARTDAGALFVDVGGPAERELRGVWVASAINLDWPATQGLSADAGRATLEALITRMADAGFNAVFFQVRPESDALYASSLEPWSRFLTGTQGQSPGWDPLATALELAHAKGLEVHAWLNPYRGLIEAGSQTASTHVTQVLRDAGLTYNKQVVMNPAEPAVRAHVLAVVKDLLDHYDVDGLHFDDYFYPYPASDGSAFPDEQSYRDYLSDGGTAPLAAWRRDNVDALVSRVMALVEREHPQVRFGIAPFGIWKDNVPAGIHGLSSYDVLACDSVKWMNEGWVDYLAPQLYWPTTQAAQSYTTLATWWALGTPPGRSLFPGHAANRIGSSSSWSLSEYRSQIVVTRSLRANQAQGDLHFRASFITQATFDLLAKDLYAKPALVPRLMRASAAGTPAPPSVSRLVQTVTLVAPRDARFLAVYRRNVSGAYELNQVVGARTSALQLDHGTWAISAVATGGAESQGILIDVP